MSPLTKLSSIGALMRTILNHFHSSGNVSLAVCVTGWLELCLLCYGGKCKRNDNAQILNICNMYVYKYMYAEH